MMNVTKTVILHIISRTEFIEDLDTDGENSSDNSDDSGDMLELNAHAGVSTAFGAGNRVDRFSYITKKERLPLSLS